jgi:broad specificity phosphatase PhoE
MERTFVVIRHSERPSFNNIPMEDWDNIRLTPRGVEAANDFGNALVNDVKMSNLCFYGWGLKRCMDTAESIASGADNAARKIHRIKTLHLRSPIADREEYDKSQRSGHWNEFLVRWLSADAKQNAMVPVDEYAQDIFRELLNPKFSGSQNTSIIVTHDLHILPLVSYVFGVPIHTLDYLDGVVIRSTSKEVQIGFGKIFRQLEFNQLVK